MSAQGEQDPTDPAGREPDEVAVADLDDDVRPQRRLGAWREFAEPALLLQTASKTWSAPPRVVRQRQPTSKLERSSSKERAGAHLHVEPPLRLVALVVVDLEQVDGLDALDEALLGRRGRGEDDRDEGKDARRVEAGDGEGRVGQRGLLRDEEGQRGGEDEGEVGAEGGGVKRGEDAHERGGR